MQNLLDACFPCETFCISSHCVTFVAALVHIIKHADRQPRCDSECVTVRVWCSAAYTIRMTREDLKCVLALIIDNAGWRNSVTHASQLPARMLLATHFFMTPHVQRMWFPAMSGATALQPQPCAGAAGVRYVTVGCALVAAHSLSAAVLATLRCSVGLVHGEHAVEPWYTKFVTAAHTSASAVRNVVESMDDSTLLVHDMVSTLHDLNVFKRTAPDRKFVYALDAMSSASPDAHADFITAAIANPLLTITNM